MNRKPCRGSLRRTVLASLPVGLLAFLGVGAGCAATAQGSADISTDQKSLAEYDLARDALHNGRLREALHHVEEALEADESNADAAYLGAVVHLAFCNGSEASSDCRYADAEKFARQALAANPEHREAKNALGVILIHERRPAEAVEILRPLAEDILYPSPEKSWGNLGWAYLEQGATDQAIDALRRAVAAQPLFCAGQYRLGVAYEKKGDARAAYDTLTKALETDRDECKRMQDAFAARARVAIKLGAAGDARKDYEQCRTLQPATDTGRRCTAELARLP